MDGALVAERQAAGLVQSNDTEFSVGSLAGGEEKFAGTIDEVSVASVALSDAWIKTANRNLADPTGFVRTVDGFISPT